MPTMLRIPGKAKKIAERILGTPITTSKTRWSPKKTQPSGSADATDDKKQLLAEETIRVR